eukprot:4962410-Prymnesium_polylepis.2
MLALAHRPAPVLEARGCGSIFSCRRQTSCRERQLIEQQLMQRVGDSGGNIPDRTVARAKNIEQPAGRHEALQWDGTLGAREDVVVNADHDQRARGDRGHVGLRRPVCKHCGERGAPHAQGCLEAALYDAVLHKLLGRRSQVVDGRRLKSIHVLGREREARCVDLVRDLSEDRAVARSAARIHENQVGHEAWPPARERVGDDAAHRMSHHDRPPDRLGLAEAANVGSKLRDAVAIRRLVAAAEPAQAHREDAQPRAQERAKPVERVDRVGPPMDQDDGNAVCGSLLEVLERDAVWQHDAPEQDGRGGRTPGRKQRVGRSGGRRKEHKADHVARRHYFAC